MFIHSLRRLFFGDSFPRTLTSHKSELNKWAFPKIVPVFLGVSPANGEQRSVWKFTDSRVAVGFRITTQTSLPWRLVAGLEDECSSQDQNRTKGQKGTEGLKIRMKREKPGTTVAFLNC